MTFYYPINRSVFTSAIACLLVVFFFIHITSVSATNHADSCANEYKKLSKQHADNVTQHKHGSSPYFKSIHKIEDHIFVAFQSCPKDALLFTLMGEVQISLGNLQLANIYAKKAFRFDDSVWQTHHLLGTTLSMQGQYEKGLKHLVKAADLAKDKPVLVFNLCSTYLTARQFKNTIQACTNLIQRKDHQLHGPAYHIRGQAYMAIKKTELAQDDFNKAKTHGHSR